MILNPIFGDASWSRGVANEMHIPLCKSCWQKLENMQKQLTNTHTPYTSTYSLPAEKMTKWRGPTYAVLRN